MLAFLLFACTPEGSTESAGPTYHEDVAPILADNCVRCHSAGNIGGFALDDHAHVSAVGQAVAAAVASRTMPPFLADNSGSCRTYQHAAWLSEEEIATVVDWVEGGMAEGDPANGPEPVVAEAGLAERATHSLPMEEAYVADFEGRDDDYRCFLVDPGIEEEGYVTAFEIVAGVPEIVHHVIVYAPEGGRALDDALELDAQDPGPGYSCFGGPRVSSSMVAAWAPGRTVWDYPEGTGIHVEPGQPMIVQMHYNNAGGADPDNTVVKLEVKREVERELTSWFLVNTDIQIPPGEEAHVETQTVSLRSYVGFPVGPIEILAVGPHMHSIGRSLYAEVRYKDSDDTACLVDLPRWDFNWQYAYTFDEPVRMEGPDQLHLECVFDSSGRSASTQWGDGTSDEMCLLTLYTVAAD